MMKQRLIRATQGVISILLSVTMLPLFSMAAVLIEASRYTEASEALESTTEVSTLSTLANYDDYLMRRFGLMATEQEDGLGSTYEDYFEANLPVGIFSESSSGISGMEPLSDSDVLYQQVLETGRYAAPTRLLTDGLDIKELVKQLESIGKMNSLFGAFQGATETVQATAQLGQDLKALHEHIEKKLDPQKTDYDKKYDTWRSRVDELAEAKRKVSAQEREVDSLANRQQSQRDAISNAQGSLKDLQNDLTDLENDLKRLNEELEELKDPEAPQTPDTKKIEEKEKEIKEKEEEIERKQRQIRSQGGDIRALQNKLNELDRQMQAAEDKLAGLESAENAATGTEMSARYAYIRATQAWEGLLQDYIKKIDAITKDLSKLADKISKTIKDGNKWTGDKKNLGIALAQIDEFTKKMVDNLEKMHLTEHAGDVNAQIAALKKQVERVRSYVVGENSSLPTGYNESYHREVTYIDKDELWKVLTAPNEKLEETKELWAALKGMASAAKTMFKMQTLYDPFCSANVSSVGGAPSETYHMITALCTSVDELGTAVDKLDEPPLGWIESFVHLGNSLVQVCKFFTALGERVVQIASNVANTVAEPERLLFNMCMTYELSNRTNYDRSSSEGNAGRSLTGFLFKDRKLPAGSKVGSGGSMAEINADMGSGASANCFVGAEFEYLLEGTSSEISNQSLTFADLYFLRLFLDVMPIMKNGEVKAMAGVGNLVGLGWLVYVAEILMEPVVDTILLVNDVDVDLYASKIFLTPSGVPVMLNEFIAMEKLKLTGDEQKEIEEELRSLTHVKGVSGSGGSGYVAGLRKFNYTEHMFLLLTIIGDQDESIRRYQEIITMEKKNTMYHAGAAGDSFSLTNAYTRLHAKSSGTMSDLLPIPSLSSRSPFHMEREIYRGY